MVASVLLGCLCIYGDDLNEPEFLLALYAFTREIAEMETAAFFRGQYDGRGGKEIFADFDAVMEKIGKKRVPAWDKIS